MKLTTITDQYMLNGSRSRHALELALNQRVLSFRGTGVRSRIYNTCIDALEPIREVIEERTRSLSDILLVDTLRDPDSVGSSEYRAIYETIEDADFNDLNNNEIRNYIESILNEFELSVRYIRQAMEDL